MDITHNPNLTSSELGILWNTYMLDTMSVCILKHFLGTVKDTSTESILEFALEIAKEHIEEIREVFEKEHIPIPDGFSENEVNPNAPRLFSDVFYLRYLEHMGRVGLGTYALSKAIASRKDMREMINRWYNKTNTMYDMVVDVSQEKGVYVRSPFIAYPSEVQYVEDTKFLGGMLGLGKKRPLLAIEIAHIGTNIEITNVARSVALGFSQVAQSEKLRDYFKRGYDIAKKHTGIFFDILKENDGSNPSTWDSTISETTTAPFSDKIMLLLTLTLCSIGVGNYGTSLSQSFRKDIATDYARLISEVSDYALDGNKIMIKNGWMEKPPQTVDRDKLIKTGH